MLSYLLTADSFLRCNGLGPLDGSKWKRRKTLANSPMRLMDYFLRRFVRDATITAAASDAVFCYAVHQSLYQSPSHPTLE